MSTPCTVPPEAEAVDTSHPTAVVGTGTATSSIRTGQLIRVDGDTGTVTILED